MDKTFKICIFTLQVTNFLLIVQNIPITFRNNHGVINRVDQTLKKMISSWFSVYSALTRLDDIENNQTWFTLCVVLQWAPFAGSPELCERSLWVSTQ